MRDLINATIESLIKHEAPEYVERSRIGHAMKNSVLDGMKQMASDKNNCSYLAMVQALFESGFLNTTERCFNLDQLWQYIYGVKVYESLSTFTKLFGVLQQRGHTTHDATAYNPHGDNYYSALQFLVRPDEDDIKVQQITADCCGEAAEPWATDVFRKVIVVENQSPTYAVVLDHSIFTKEPVALHFLRLKENYTDPEVLQELINIEFNVGDSMAYSPFGWDNKACKLITSLDVRSMSCKPVLFPHIIESILFSLYSCYDAI